MNWSVAYDLAALIASLVALVLSTLVAIRQSQIAKGSNHAAIVVELYRDFRSVEYRQQEHLLWSELPKIKEPMRFSEIPEPVQSAAYYVCNLYQMVAVLISLGIIDKRLAILPGFYRMMRTWNIVKPFVEAERSARGNSLPFLNLFEALVMRVSTSDVTAISGKLSAKLLRRK
jgi:hypothetical protein